MKITVNLTVQDGYKATAEISVLGLTDDTDIDYVYAAASGVHSIIKAWKARKK